METISSGKQLCDAFFDDLAHDSTIDSSVADVLQKLYGAGELTKDTILEELKGLRGNGEEDLES